MQLKIDPEFQSLIQPLSPDEYRQLETFMLKKDNNIRITLRW